jgi:hypothetical protein
MDCGTIDRLTAFAIGPVPEPTSVGLLGFGLVLIGGLRRRERTIR